MNVRLDVEDESRAAEFALGLLEGAELRSAERRMRRDGRFRAEVDMWQTHFAALFEQALASPPAHALDGIENRLFGTSLRSRLDRALHRLRASLTPVEIAAVLVIKVGLLLGLAVLLL